MKSTEKLPKNRILTQTGPKTTLDQWLALAALIDSAGYEGAAEALDRSQSSVNYQVARLQEALKCRLLKIRGRRAVLTETGAALLTRARGLLEDWRSLEAFAHSLKRGIEPVLKLIADAAFPREILIRTLLELKRRCPTTQVDLSDAVLSGTEDAILDGTADVAITAHVPPGVLGDWLYETTFLACASPAHPLHGLGRQVSRRDLERHQQVVLRDSGTRSPRDEGYLGAELRWTVSGNESSLAIIESGLAYAWLPASVALPALDAGKLKMLPLESGANRKVPLYVVSVRGSDAGPVARTVVQLLHEFSRKDAGSQM